MAYQTQKREEFLKSLKNIEINQLPEETSLKDFEPIGLSNLYHLFIAIQDKTISAVQFSHLNNLITLNYPQDIASLLHNPITESEVSDLLEIMKEEYLQIIYNKNPRNINKEEQEQLKTILSHHFPSLFLDFIENPVSMEEFSEQEKLIQDTFSSLVDDYYNQVTPHGQKNTTYIESAIYLIYQKLHPELSIIFPNRIKGINSYQSNTKKELTKSIKNMLPSNLKDGIVISDMQNHLTSNQENKSNYTDKVNTDTSAMTIVLNYFDDAIYFDESDPENENILKLKKERNNNLTFLQSVKKYLNENDYLMTEEDYFQTYIQLLEHLQNTTYPECSHEIKEGSYSTRLAQAKENYKKHTETDSFAPNATDMEIEELYSLTDCLKRRLDDKLEHEILKVTFPHILEHPLLAKKFKITSTFLKDIKKANGFCAIYYVLTDANGEKIEVQLQSRMRYKESKTGLSNHNDLPNKTVDITPFFELVNPSLATDDPELLEKHLSILGRTSKRQEKALNEHLTELIKKLSYVDNKNDKRALNLAIIKLKKKLDAIETAKNSVKIKDVFEEEYDMLTMTKDENDFELKNIGDRQIKVYHTKLTNHKDENDFELENIGGKKVKVYNTKTHKYTQKYTIKQYLPLFAQVMSPASMSVIGSAHTTFDSVAHINQKGLIERFTEILRKNDEVPYLAELLIDKLKEILNEKESSQISWDDLEQYAEEDYYSK